MRRPLLLAAVLLLAGCGEPPREPFLATRAAEPQRVELGWREAHPEAERRLVFQVHELEITRRGWTASISVTNETGIPFHARSQDAELSYGVMLFRTGDLAELESAAEAGTLPAVRRASTITPMPPTVLQTGTTWRAELKGRGALADGAWLRVVFGPLRADGVPPEGMQERVVWITDRSHRL